MLMAAALLWRGMMLIVMLIFADSLRGGERAHCENGARQHKLQFHCALPKEFLDRRRPTPSHCGTHG